MPTRSDRTNRGRTRSLDDELDWSAEDSFADPDDDALFGDGDGDDWDPDDEDTNDEGEDDWDMEDEEDDEDKDEDKDKDEDDDWGPIRRRRGKSPA